MLPSTSKILTPEARKVLMTAYKRAQLANSELAKQNILCVATEEVKRMCPNAFITETEDERRTKAQIEHNKHERNLEYAKRLAFSTTHNAITIASMADISLEDAKRIKYELNESRKSKARRNLDSIFK